MYYVDVFCFVVGILYGAVALGKKALAGVGISPKIVTLLGTTPYSQYMWPRYRQSALESFLPNCEMSRA